jgi:hypothetical protein
LFILHIFLFSIAALHHSVSSMCLFLLLYWVYCFPSVCIVGLYNFENQVLSLTRTHQTMIDSATINSQHIWMQHYFCASQDAFIYSQSQYDCCEWQLVLLYHQPWIQSHHLLRHLADIVL